VGSPERKRGRATGSALVPQRAVLFKVASPLKTVDGDRGIFTWDGAKTLSTMGVQLPTSTVFHAGFLNHQQYVK